MNTNRAALIAAVSLALAATFARAEVRLGSMFSDHMVLQREIACPVSGTTTPNAKVEAFVDGKRVAADTADASGAFELKLPPMSAPGPYAIEVRSGDDVAKLNDVLVGEVWLCSGQSNMQWAMRASADAASEIARADHPNVRLFHVPRNPSDAPETTIDARWQVCSPETVATFSAVAFYFGRHLNRELDVPIGLVASSVGGTPAEAWTPVAKLKTLTDLPRVSAMAANAEASRRPDAVERFNAAILDYMRATDRLDAGVSDAAKSWAAVDVDPADWTPIYLPADATKRGVPSGSVTWYRRDIDVPADQAGKELVLTLGVIDEFDTTYFNGQPVGKTDHTTPNWWTAQRRYVVPAERVKAGRNVIAVRNVDIGGAAGLTGPLSVMRATFAAPAIDPAVDPTAVPTTSAATQPAATRPVAIGLNNDWTFRVERRFDPQPEAPSATQPVRPMTPYNFSFAGTPGALYDGMIAPIGDYAIRGAIWYQGESNATRYAEYAPLLTAMIESWREQFGVGPFPFYIVGLANYRAATDDPNAFSDWAMLRDAQRTVARTVRNAAMSVTIDIGNPLDIHPANKQDVGKRLALLALDQTYGKRVVSRGPTLNRATFEDGQVVLNFDHVGGGLAARGEKLASFSVAGEDGKFVWADARIEGARVIVSSPAVPTPAHVRYAFSDNPTASLFNKEGLPAEPFTTSRNAK